MCIALHIVEIGMRTNGDGLDSDTLLNMSICRIISVLSLEDFLSAQGIHKGGSA